MIRFSRTQLQPIGLDVGYDGVRMIQLEVSGDSVAVRAAAREGFGHAQGHAEEEIRETLDARFAVAGDAVRRMLAEQPFVGQRVVVALPPEMLHVKNYRLPPMPASELESATRLEARNLFSFDTEEAQVRCLPAGEVRQGTDVLQEVIVLAVRNEDLDRYVELVHRCGVTVASVDIEPCALFRSIERFVRRRQDELEVHVLVEVGLQQTQVVIGRGRDISFLKTIDIGSTHFHQSIATKLGISAAEARALRQRLLEGTDSGDAESADISRGRGSFPVPPAAATGAPGDRPRDPVRQAVFDATRSSMEQLARELSLCVRYQSVTFRGHRPTRVRLLGGEAGDPHLRAIIQSVLNISVEPGRPLANVDISRMREADRRAASASTSASSASASSASSEWAKVLGLGLRWTSGRFAMRDGRPRGADSRADVEADAEADAEAEDAEGEQKVRPYAGGEDGADAEGAEDAEGARRHGGTEARRNEGGRGEGPEEPEVTHARG